MVEREPDGFESQHDQHRSERVAVRVVRVLQEPGHLLQGLLLQPLCHLQQRGGRGEGRLCVVSHLLLPPGHRLGPLQVLRQGEVRDRGGGVRGLGECCNMLSLSSLSSPL